MSWTLGQLLASVLSEVFERPGPPALLSLVPSLTGCSSCPPRRPPSRHTNGQKTTRRACGEETGILSPPFSSTSPVNPRRLLIYTLVIFCDTAEEEVGYLFCPLQLHEAGLWSPYHSYVPHTPHLCISPSPTCSSAGP